MHEFQLVALEHEKMAGDNYNWRTNIFSDLNIEQVTRKKILNKQNKIFKHIDKELIKLIIDACRRHHIAMG
jgi:hypothetical protein